jgi:hypothetical protein
MPFLKKLLIVSVMLAIGVAGGGSAAFFVRTIITGTEYRIPHGAAGFLVFLTLMGAIAGSIVGAIKARRIVRRM